MPRIDRGDLASTSISIDAFFSAGAFATGDAVKDRASVRSPRVWRTFEASARFRTPATRFVDEIDAHGTEILRANGRTMMLNGPVEIDGGSAGCAAGIDVNERRAALHRKLMRIAKARALLDLNEAEALREAQKLQLWKQFGHTSLVDYMVQKLGYTSWRTAEDRLRLANALPELPKLTSAIQCGQINMSQARELARVATPETEQVWIEKAQDLNVRQVEQVVAGHHKGDLPEDPIDPRLVRKTMYLSVRPETEVLFREARRALEKERGGMQDDDAVLEALCVAMLRPSSRSGGTKAVEHAAISGDSSSAGSTHVGGVTAGETAEAEVTLRAVTQGSADPAASISTHVGGVTAGRTAEAEGTLRAVTQGSADRAASISTHVGGGVMASVTDHNEMDVVPAAYAGAPYRVAVTVCKVCKRGWQHGAGAVVEMSPASIARAQCDAQWIGDLESDVVERARQEITPATRRKVLHSDESKCRVPGCQGHRNLDVHHIVHREHGGTNEPSNLLTLCEAHHLAHHDGTLSIVRDQGEVKFRFEGRNKFTRKAREVATREALRRRGIDRVLVKAIMERTVNEIGETALNEEQWLAIAMRYAREARN